MNRYTIIIPVFGALEQVKRCLESVLANTDLSIHKLLVIDDASRDAEVLRYLARQKVAIEGGWFEGLVMHDRNVGFVQTANEGIRQAIEWKTEPILLNSDTIVPPRWVERLDEARTEAEARGVKVCSVSPLSNKCTQYSVPNQWDGDLPRGLTVEQMDRIVEETSSEDFPAVMTNVGFCMLMTREAIEAVGVFDRKWGKGYGEETDWCQRAKDCHFSCILADNVYVYHEHRASFGPKAESHWEEHQAMFEAQYPKYREEVEKENLTHPLTSHRVRIANRLRPRPTGAQRKRLVFVCHNWGQLGGLEIFQRRLVNELAQRFEVTVLHPRRGDMVENTTFIQEPNGVLRIVMSPRLVQNEIELGVFPFELHADLVEVWFWEVLEALAPDVVHFQHLGGWGSFRLPEIASAYAQTVLNVHDDFYLCPSYLTAGWKCGRDSAACCEQCVNCVNEEMTVKVEGRHTERLPLLLEQRGQEIGAMFANFNRVVFPTATIRDRYEMNAPALRELDVPLMVIPHGVPRYPFIRTYHPTEKTRVAWVGGVLNEKGWAAFAEACKILRDAETFEFSVFGEWSEGADRSDLQHVKFHRRYAPEDLPQLLQNVDLAVPAVARKESYGLVIDECLAASCPVLLPDVQSIRERMASFNVHYLWNDPHSLAAALIEFRKHVLEYSEAERLESREREMSHVRTMHDCAEHYAAMYEGLLTPESQPRICGDVGRTKDGIAFMVRER